MKKFIYLKWSLFQIISLGICFFTLMFGVFLTMMISFLMNLLGIKGLMDALEKLGFYPSILVMMIVYCAFWYIFFKRFYNKDMNFYLTLIFAAAPNILLTIFYLKNITFKQIDFDTCAIIMPHMILLFLIYSVVLLPTYLVLVNSKYLELHRKADVRKMCISLSILIAELAILVLISIKLIGIETLRLIF